jgi:hypothetical protein
MYAARVIPSLLVSLTIMVWGHEDGAKQTCW